MNKKSRSKLGRCGVIRFVKHFRLVTSKLPATTFAVLALSSGHAFAQAGKDPSQMLKNISQFILGPFGQTLAVLGIVAIGLSWMFGRASLGLVAGVIGGIVIMFGASFMATALTGGAG